MTSSLIIIQFSGDLYLYWDMSKCKVFTRLTIYAVCSKYVLSNLAVVVWLSGISKALMIAFYCTIRLGYTIELKPVWNRIWFFFHTRRFYKIFSKIRKIVCKMKGVYEMFRSSWIQRWIVIHLVYFCMPKWKPNVLGFRLMISMPC